MTIGIVLGLIVIYFIALPIQAIVEAKYADEQTKRIWRMRHPDDSDLPPIRRAVRRWIMK